MKQACSSKAKFKFIDSVNIIATKSMKHLHPAYAEIDVNKCRTLKKVPAYDSSYSVLTDKRRMSVKHIKIFEFFDFSMIIESDDSIRQVMSYRDFHPKSTELLQNLYKFYSTGVYGNDVSIFIKSGSRTVQDSDFVNGFENPIPATIIGYHGVFKIEFEDKNLYTYAIIASVCDA